jgi:PAS domain S-box-containing protein
VMNGARDISEQKAAERELTESARHFELIHDLVATCGFDGYFKRLNGAWERVFGWTPEELLAKPFMEIVHPDDREAVASEVTKLASGETTAEFKIRGRTSDGRWLWTEWSASPDVAAGLFYCVGREISDRMEAERARSAERRQFADAQQIASVGSWEVDLETGVRTWSAQHYRNHGFEPKGPPPALERLLERIHSDDREAARERIERLLEGESELHFSYRVILPDGRTREIEVEGRPLVDADGSRRLLGTSRDVTAERDAERLKDEFFGLVSHELRTPLTSIIGYTELLAEVEAENLSPQGRRFLEVVERNARRELSLVGDLLLLTKITAGTFEIEIGRADLTELAASTLETARPLAEQAGVELSLEAADPWVVDGDPHRLAQVVENLVSNAIKFTPRGGRVDVRVQGGSGSVALEVADTGIGIEEDDLGRLFDRMYRAGEAERRHIQGTGLGLTIVKAIIDAHEATIAVSSEPQKGTTFRVELPPMADCD